VEEIEKAIQPFEDDVELLLIELTLLRGFVGERWDQECLYGDEDFFPQTCHDSDHCRTCQGLVHDTKIVVEVCKERVQGVSDVYLARRLRGLWSLFASIEVAGRGRHCDLGY